MATGAGAGFPPGTAANTAAHTIMADSAPAVDPTTLNPLSPEVIARQATINIGTIGHVAHGKSTLVKAISGVHTVRFKNELERNITIKLGYANAKVIIQHLFTVLTHSVYTCWDAYHVQGNRLQMVNFG